jgi:hypothetical protein
MSKVPPYPDLVAENLKVAIRLLKKLYLERQKKKGGTNAGFREFVRVGLKDRPDMFVEALAMATDHGWRAPPADKGADLFNINGIPLPEYITRPAAGYYAGDEEEDGIEFEQVDHKSATVQDGVDDVTIKMRKAAQAAAKAEVRAKQIDVARRRAKGNLTMLLKDLADPPPKKKKG